VHHYSVGNIIHVYVPLPVLPGKRSSASWRTHSDETVQRSAARRTCRVIVRELLSESDQSDTQRSVITD
jgi:hypothetical protein